MSDSGATTEYGTWWNWMESATVENTVSAYVNGFEDDFDFEAAVSDYRAEVNAALPEGVTLNGNHFYGPYPRPEGLDLRPAIEGVDLGVIVMRHPRK